MNKKKIYTKNPFSNKEGVIYNNENKKFVVVVKNPNKKMRGSKPFLSIFQHSDEVVANERYEKHLEEFPD